MQSKSKISRRAGFVLGVAVAMTAPAISFAQTYTWTGGGSANFSSPTAFSPTLPAGGGTSTILVFGGSTAIVGNNDTTGLVVNGLTFTNSAPTTINGNPITFDGTAPSLIQNGAGAVTINAPLILNATTTVTGTGTGSVTLGGMISDSAYPGLTGTNTAGRGLIHMRSNASLTLTGGANVSFVAASTGTVNFTGGTYNLASSNNPGAGPGLGAPANNVALSAGNVAGQTGVININNGANITGGNMYIGNFAGSTGILNVDGASLTSVDDAAGHGNYGRFGVYGGTGYINIINGGTVTCRLGELGRVDNSVTFMTVTGSGSTFTVEQLILGRGNNTQQVAVLNGGSIVGNGGGQIQIAAGTNTTSSLLISGSGSVLQNLLTPLFISTTTNANGTLTVNNGGDAELGQLSVGGGGAAAGVGTVIVDGATLNCTSLSMAQTAGTGSQGIAIFRNGATSNIGNITVGNGANGQATVTVTGSTMTITNMGFGNGVGSTGTFIATGSANVTASGQITIGSLAGGSGDLLISNGATFTLGSAGLLTVGARGNGTLIVDAATLSSDATTYFGSPFSSQAADGVVATMIVRNGGTATINNDFVMGRNVTGSGAQTGSLLVTGAGSNFTVTGLDDDMIVGYQPGATETALFTNGATGTFNELIIGQISATATQLPTIGTLTFAGAGTTGSLGVSALIANGNYSRASLVISDGAVVGLAGTLFTGYRTNTYASILVTGTGTQFNVSGQTQLGSGASGSNAGVTSLVVSNNAVMNSIDTTFLAGQTNASTTVTVDHATWTTAQIQVATNGGTEVGSGTVVLQNAGTLAASGGIFLGTGGTVTLSGASLLTAQFINRGTTGSIGSVVVNDTSKILFPTSTASGSVIFQSHIAGTGTIENANGQLAVFFNVYGNPFSGTYRASNGGALAFTAAVRPNGTSAAAGGTIEAIGSDSVNGASEAFFSTNTSNDPSGRVAAQVHVLRANGGGLIDVTPSNVYQGNPSAVLVTDVLDLGGATPTGLLDLANNDLVVRSSTLATIRGLVSAYFNGGKTVGIGSTVAGVAGTPDPRDAIATLAVVQNVNGMGGTLFSTFDSVAVQGSDILVKYTYIGDTDLNGTVNGDDLANLMAGLTGHLTGWTNGDLNYDNVVNATDLSLLLTSLRTEGASFGDPSDGGGAVPEPTLLAPLAIALPMLSRRRR